MYLGSSYPVPNLFDTWSLSKGQFDVISTNARHELRLLFYLKLNSLLPRAAFGMRTFGLM
jgi:hypothetical protein